MIQSKVILTNNNSFLCSCLQDFFSHKQILRFSEVLNSGFTIITCPVVKDISTVFIEIVPSGGRMCMALCGEQ